MTRIVLVRHGETIWHEGNRYAGRSDVPLNSIGMQQAEQLAIWAAGAGLAGIWSSTLSRAICTARSAAEAVGLPLNFDPRLVELDFGDGEGLTEAEMQLRFPVERAAFERDPVRHHLPGGEDPVGAAERGVAALRDIATAAPGERTLVVAHNTLIRLVLCRLLGIPLSTYRTVFAHLLNGARTEIALAPAGSEPATLLALNVPLTIQERKPPKV